MAGAGKTLKVSYGSFSCTLEGFDDPVATLRSITEHFQSLSAPERLFAAEGPVPGIDLIQPGLAQEPPAAVPMDEAGSARVAPPSLPSDSQPSDSRSPDSLSPETQPPEARSLALRPPAVLSPSPMSTPPAARPQSDAPVRRDDGADRDADISRLLSQTIGQMEGEDQRRRQATIGHLKAAVAATADDPAAGLGGDPKRADRYRADLARVMRPPRPDVTRLPPVPERQIPLLLLPELRVPPPRAASDPERPEPAEAAAADPGADPGAAPDFADFAGRMATSSLPDLIEAAGAFVICAEAASAFTRPDLMRHLSALPALRGGTPEDQMRGFGLLLRHGRILRADRGTFTLPRDAPVLARARRLLG